MRAVVTGASRGIGFEYVRQLAARGDSVVAAVRDPARADAVRGIAGDVTILPLDVSDAASVATFADALGSAPLDLLVNNAGSYGPQGFPEGAAYQAIGAVNFSIFAHILDANVLGPMRVTEALLAPLAAAKGMVVMMSSDLGSITNNAQGGSHAYRSSKAALNMLTKGLSVDLAAQGISVVSMAPGWTQTDLGSHAAHWPVAESVRLQLETLAKLTRADSGRFVNLKGEAVPW
jgi:NAD(P)-dependent dehydrogenase (short-subunit alcohol dehydrogenase family)